MLTVNPKDVLTFPQAPNCETNINLCCKAVVPIIYKIQTTSPEKFRVRPRHGLLEPRQAVTISILLRPEHLLGDLAKDKFLVMCMPAPLDRDLTTMQNIADIWKEKNNSGPVLEQHRLTCLYATETEGFRSAHNCSNNPVITEKSVHLNEKSTSPRSSDGSGSGAGGGIDELVNTTQKLEKQLKFTQFMQYFTLFILLLMSVAVVYLLRLEMDFSFLRLNSTPSNAPPTQDRHIPLRTRISNSLPKMGRLGRRPR